MSAMHNPEVKPVDNSAVDKRHFNPQLSTMKKTSAARVDNALVKLCTYRVLWARDGYPQKVIHLRFIDSSEKLFICLFFFFMLSPIRVPDQAPVRYWPSTHRPSRALYGKTGWKLTYGLAFSRIAGLLKRGPSRPVVDKPGNTP